MKNITKIGRNTLSRLRIRARASTYRFEPPRKRCAYPRIGCSLGQRSREATRYAHENPLPAQQRLSDQPIQHRSTITSPRPYS